jgi:hypothetical protein
VSSPLQHFVEHSSPLQLERAIASTDAEIDDPVYHLYGGVFVSCWLDFSSD